jgi:hypothetical protein
MSNYIRTTRERFFSHLELPLSQAIREYFQAHRLGDPETDIRLCCETTAERRPAGKLASLLDGYPDTTLHLVTLLTDEWFVWGRVGDKSGTLVTGIRLKGLQAKAFTMKRTNDMQLEVTGFIGDTKDYVRGNLEMGPEPAAQKFCDVVLQAVKSSNPKPARTRPWWLGG